jgi:SAM-dependent methyltransferase
MEAVMKKISPGGAMLMEAAIGSLNLSKGSRVLDIGCGAGDTIARLADTHGYDCVGIDKSADLIQAGKEGRPWLDLRTGDASLPGAVEPSGFDAVLIECVLSVSEAPSELLRAAARAAKPGGYILISDLCERKEAEDATSASETEEPSPCLISAAPSVTDKGLVSIEGLTATLQSMGISPISLEDRSRYLDAFAAEIIFEHGSFDAYLASAVPEGADPSDFFSCGPYSSPHAPGYFLSIFWNQSNY